MSLPLTVISSLLPRESIKYLEGRYELALFYGDEEYAKQLRQRIDNIQKEIDGDLT